MLKKKACVNALNGLPSFLQQDIGEYRHKHTGVNALNGLPSFLRSNKEYFKESCRDGVNALNGLPSFLHKNIF